MEKFKLTFYEGGNSVTGVNFLMEGLSKKILVDAGLPSKCVSDDFALGEAFPYNPEEIDFLFVSHYDLAHTGKIPRLVKEGFKGVIYSTAETKFISELLFRDCLEESIKKEESVFCESDIKKTMEVWKTISYGDVIDLGDNLSVGMYDAGHILGSSFFNFDHNGKNILFANAIGGKFVADLSGIPTDKKIDYLVMESIYGNKAHELIEGRKEFLEDIIEGTINQHGSILIPVSSVDKIFVVLRDINKLLESGKIPKTPIFINSPIASEVVSVYSQLFKCVKEDCDTLGDFLKHFNNLKFITEENKLEEIDKIESKIVISGIGMSGKKMLENQIKKYIVDPNSAIIFPDYQISGSLGSLIQEGGDSVKIGNENFKIRARVESIDGYSSHADYNILFKFVDSLKYDLKKVFVTIGEPESTSFFASKLRDHLSVDAAAVLR
ncbi:MBL fold metallo-hydrolase, partial [Patescibacteria group bacterium]|nr:MBL fold metallo-hydrolase [Patescibacteria group bacterium]